MFINAYKLPHSLRELVQDMIKGIIQESNSSWNSPIYLVAKKDGTIRLVIDFRRVNEVTVDDHYPPPVLRDLFMCLERGKIVFVF